MVSKSKAVLGELTPNNVGQLKTINSVLFPVYYNEKFYKNALESGELAKLGETSGNILNSHFLQIRIRIRIRMENLEEKKIKKWKIAISWRQRFPHPQCRFSFILDSHDLFLGFI